MGSRGPWRKAIAELHQVCHGNEAHVFFFLVVVVVVVGSGGGGGGFWQRDEQLLVLLMEAMLQHLA